MPKKSGVDTLAVLDLLSTSKEALIIDGKIANPTHQIWTELSNQLDQKISAKGLYTFVKLDRHNSWSILGLNSQSSESEATDEGEVVHCCGDGDSDAAVSSAEQSFQLTVPFEEWVKFMPQSVKYTVHLSLNERKSIHQPEVNILTSVVTAKIVEVNCKLGVWKSLQFKPRCCSTVFLRTKMYHYTQAVPSALSLGKYGRMLQKSSVRESQNLMFGEPDRHPSLWTLGIPSPAICPTWQPCERLNSREMIKRYFIKILFCHYKT